MSSASCSLALRHGPAADAPLASFRDPAGLVFSHEGRLLRLVRPSALPDLEAFLGSATYREFTENGHIVRTELLPAPHSRHLIPHRLLADRPDFSETPLVLEHETIWFPSYPYEWPAEMLHAAAILTLDLASSLLPEGMGLKDATPYNILFRGPSPVFIDFLSFETRRARDPLWLPYAQFVRTFLLPLLVNQRLHLPLSQVFLSRRDGLEPEEVYNSLPPLRRLLPPYLTTVSIPTWLGRKHAAADNPVYHGKSDANPEKARFILSALFTRLRRSLARLAPASLASSRWSAYAADNCYTPEQTLAKEHFLRQALQDCRPLALLDVGCNSGHYSAIAAAHGCRVVAIDRDPVVVGALWRTARVNALDILPLVVDFARPSPATGWSNAECGSFLQRARGAFDAVLMLAVLHHLLVSDRVPLPDLIRLTAELTTDLAVIEFVAPDDPLFRRLARGRDHLHADLTRAYFETQSRRYFHLVRHLHLPGATRHLYLLRKKAL